MKKVLIILFVLLAGAAGIFIYITRPVETPEAYVPEEIPVTENAVAYAISQNDSTVSFTIDEELRGSPFTVLGTTSSIYGTVQAKENVLSFETITIDARTFKTDSTNRDGAINRLIVKTEENPYITFTTDDTLALTNGSFSGTLTGALTLAGVTKEATMRVDGTITETTIQATVRVDLKRSDYNLVIPSIPFVAKVPDTFSASGEIKALVN